MNTGEIHDWKDKHKTYFIDIKLRYNGIVSN